MESVRHLPRDEYQRRLAEAVKDDKRPAPPAADVRAMTRAEYAKAKQGIIRD